MYLARPQFCNFVLFSIIDFLKIIILSFILKQRYEPDLSHINLSILHNNSGEGLAQKKTLKMKL